MPDISLKTPINKVFDIYKNDPTYLLIQNEELQVKNAPAYYLYWLFEKISPWHSFTTDLEKIDTAVFELSQRKIRHRTDTTSKALRELVSSRIIRRSVDNLKKLHQKHSLDSSERDKTFAKIHPHLETKAAFSIKSFLSAIQEKENETLKETILQTLTAKELEEYQDIINPFAPYFIPIQPNLSIKIDFSVLHEGNFKRNLFKEIRNEETTEKIQKVAQKLFKKLSSSTDEIHCESFDSLPLAVHAEDRKVSLLITLKKLGTGGFKTFTHQMVLGSSSLSEIGKSYACGFLKDDIEETDEEFEREQINLEREILMGQELQNIEGFLPVEPLIKEDELGMRLPFCNRGDLFSYLKEEKLSRIDLHKILSDIASLLSKMHSRKICHLDVKGHNILLHKEEGKPLKPFITDFGFSEKTKNEVNDLYNKFTAGYIPPEVLEGHVTHPNPKMDAYSFGMLVAKAVSSELVEKSEIEKLQRVLSDLCYSIHENKAWDDDLFQRTMKLLPDNGGGKISLIKAKELLYPLFIQKLEDLRNHLQKQKDPLLKLASKLLNPDSKRRISVEKAYAELKTTS